MKLDSSAFHADAGLIRALETRATKIVCNEDRVLFCQGDAPTGLFILREGIARLSMASSTGDVFLSMLVSSGALLGLPGLVGNQPLSLTATAFKGADVAFVTANDFSALMLSDPSLSMSVLRILAAEVRSARSAISGV